MNEPAFEEILTEVRYGETDQMGYAHHSTAVLWFEMGRVSWLRRHGMSYGQLEQSGVLLPVVEMTLRFHAPGRFEDTLAIRTRLIHLGKTRITFESRVLRVEADPGEQERPPHYQAPRTLLVSGSVELACLDRAGKIRRVPPAFHDIWEKVRAHAR